MFTKSAFSMAALRLAMAPPCGNRHLFWDAPPIVREVCICLQLDRPGGYDHSDPLFNA